jgi:hypothetical protein
MKVHVLGLVPIQTPAQEEVRSRTAAEQSHDAVLPLPRCSVVSAGHLPAFLLAQTPTGRGEGWGGAKD